MKGGPKSPADLARAVGADPPTLYRVLRALAGVGVFAERKDGRFALTPLGATLRSDRPDSMRAFAVMMVDDYNWQAWGDVLQSIKTGQTAFDRVHGLKIFDYFGKHPDKARVFGEAMTSISGTENPAVAAAYDFSKVGTLVDVGGSHGHSCLPPFSRRTGSSRASFSTSRRSSIRPGARPTSALQAGRPQAAEDHPDRLTAQHRGGRQR
jgi:hypothetical protein